MIKKILFQPWSNDRLSVFYASFSAYILWAAVQHNWALSTNSWHTQAIRVSLGGIAFVGIFLFFLSLISLVFETNKKQQFIRKAASWSLLLLFSSMIFFIPQFRFLILFLSILSFNLALIVLLFFSSKGKYIGVAFSLLVFFSLYHVYQNTIVVSKTLRHQKLLFNKIQREGAILKNCELKRYGSVSDGGYLLCGNLLVPKMVGYSYGISGRDSWGCDVSRALGIKIHQYDCFDTKKPTCSGGKFIFHPECVGPKKAMEDGRSYDTIQGHLIKNNDTKKQIVFKMDIEGAEWNSLLNTPENVLKNIEQLVVEFHVNWNSFSDEEKKKREIEIKVFNKLAKYFYLVNIHYNNHACQSNKPLPANVFEILYVNKKIGILDKNWDGAYHNINSLDAPNTSERPDCQIPTVKSTAYLSFLEAGLNNSFAK